MSSPCTSFPLRVALPNPASCETCPSVSGTKIVGTGPCSCQAQVRRRIRHCAVRSSFALARGGKRYAASTRTSGGGASAGSDALLAFARCLQAEPDGVPERGRNGIGFRRIAKRCCVGIRQPATKKNLGVGKFPAQAANGVAHMGGAAGVEVGQARPWRCLPSPDGRCWRGRARPRPQPVRRARASRAAGPASSRPLRRADRGPQRKAQAFRPATPAQVPPFQERQVGRSQHLDRLERRCGFGVVRRFRSPASGPPDRPDRRRAR